MNPMVSVVMPCFNEEAYIEECLDSILAQTYQDFEVICVDNGSTDSTVDILNRYAAVDGRFHVLFSGGYAGDARNVGMDAAQGKYLLFLDSDDFFDEALLAETVEAAETNEAEIVLFGGRTYDEKTGLLAEKMGYISWFRFPKQTVFSAEDVADRLFQLTTPAPWTKLFLRQHILDLGLRFQSLPNSNDLFFTLSALSSAGRIVGLDRDLVRYRRNKAVSVQSNKARSPLCFMEALKALNDYLVATDRAKLFDNTLKWQILSTTKYNLSTSSTDEAKDAIFDYLISNWSGWLGLDWPEENEYQKVVKDLGAYLLCAIAQYREQNTPVLLINSGLECVVPRRSAGNPAISVIVPAFNVADFVRETLQSLGTQTFKDFEIICIDDGSQDDTLRALIDCADADERISVYHQPNSGLSMSRNAGLSKAQGSYIYFIDSDDKLLPEALEILHRAASSEDLDIVHFDADCFYDLQDNLEDAKRRYEDYYHRKGEYGEVRSGFELLCAMSDRGDYLPSACLYLARKSLLDSYGAHFIPRIIHEDNAYTFQMMLNAKRAKHIPDRLYLRRLRDDSITMSRCRFNKVYGYFVCLKSMYDSLFAYEGSTKGGARFSALQVIMSVASGGQKAYAQLPQEELGGVLALRKRETKFFNKWIGSAGKSLRTIEKDKQTIDQRDAKIAKQAGKIFWLRKQVKKRDARINAIEGSRAFKLLCKIYPPLKSAGKDNVG